MLSEGQNGVDEVMSLSEGRSSTSTATSSRASVDYPLMLPNIGTLRLELSKEFYERAGLQGTPVRSGGRKHVKSRYCKPRHCLF